MQMAHVDAWSRSRSHEPANLICLCANCHQRADLERWGSKTLREYKERPWVVRYTNWNSNPIQRDNPSTVIIIDLSSSNLSEHDLDMLRYTLAGFLQMDADKIRVLSKEKGSVKLTIQLPRARAKELLSAFERKDPELLKRLPLFPIRKIEDAPDARQPSNDEDVRDKSFLPSARAGFSKASIAAGVLLVLAFVLTGMLIWMYMDAYIQPKVNLAFAELVSGTRSGNEPLELHKAQPLFMILELPPNRRFNVYVAEILPDSAPVPQWTSQALRETQDGMVTLQFPPGYFKAGAYRIVLYGVSDTQRTSLAEYDFRIQLNPSAK